MVRVLRWRVLFAVVFSAAFCGSAWAVPTARLTLQSEAGDYIGGGRDHDVFYDPAVDDVFVMHRRHLPDGSLGEVVFSLWDERPLENYALLFFSTLELGIPLQTGEYPDAERSAFATDGHPGLDVSFQHRGSNRVTGSFTILEAEFSSGQAGIGSLQRFDVIFEQHSEGREPALFGRFQFDRSGLTVGGVPEPVTGLLFLIGLGAVGCGRHRAW